MSRRWKRYIIGDDEGALEGRIGAVSPCVDGLFERHGCASGMLVTFLVEGQDEYLSPMERLAEILREKSALPAALLEGKRATGRGAFVFPVAIADAHQIANYCGIEDFVFFERGRVSRQVRVATSFRAS